MRSHVLGRRFVAGVRSIIVASFMAGFHSIERFQVNIDTVPPATAERLEQRDGVGETGGARGDQIKAGAVIGLFGGQHVQVGAAAGTVLRLGDRQTGRRRVAGVQRGA